MKIGKYIHELLLENEIVIIPGFGAFVSIYKPAEVDEDSNEFKPPSKEVSFNRQIRNNDGLLVGSVATGEGVSHFDALKKIEVERENIIYQLDIGEKVILEETGELFVNDKSEIQFLPFINDNLLLDSFGLESVALEDLVEKDTNVVIVQDLIEPEKEKQEPVEIIEKDISESKPIPVQNYEQEKEEKKKRSWLWLLLMLVPIIFVGIYLISQNKKEENRAIKIVEKPVPLIEENPILKPDSIIIDTTFVSPQDLDLTEKTDTVSVETAVPNTANYFLVGGSFKEEKNADNYLIELKNKGFKPFKLEKRGNFYIVGIGAYDTQKEAFVAKRKFTKENKGSGVWAMENKTKQDK
ncbi:MAG: hypothetical protein GQ525_01760 [Draconibacterium sp.]|nr:hypothetical protein [Draconibacterium sp.]